MALTRLTVLVFRHPHGRWEARILEHDMSAEGRTREMVIDMVLRLARAHIAYDIRHNREPLSAFGPASRIFWTGFEDGTSVPLPSTVEDLGHYEPIEVRIRMAQQTPTTLRLVHTRKTA